ncbi:MAG: hypothetical protein TU36_006445 [Vulcanisaeta sp. AZ3]|jgi:hypothetical protein|nr:MAG: hypothetical protein TU36_04900 [Vulcanisaeta sp. AZ3]
MALDRLIAEVVLLVASLFLGYTLFMVLGHVDLAMSLMNNVERLSSASISIPDAVIVSNGTSNQLYIVIYNNGYVPVYLKSVTLWHNSGRMVLPINDTYLSPGNYVLLHNTIPYTQCRVSVIFCIVNTTLCMVYTVNTTNYVIP